MRLRALDLFDDNAMVPDLVSTMDEVEYEPLFTLGYLFPRSIISKEDLEALQIDKYMQVLKSIPESHVFSIEYPHVPQWPENVIYKPDYSDTLILTEKDYDLFNEPDEPKSEKPGNNITETAPAEKSVASIVAPVKSAIKSIVKKIEPAKAETVVKPVVKSIVKKVEPAEAETVTKPTVKSIVKKVEPAKTKPESKSKTKGSSVIVPRIATKSANSDIDLNLRAAIRLELPDLTSNLERLNLPDHLSLLGEFEFSRFALEPKLNRCGRCGFLPHHLTGLKCEVPIVRREDRHSSTLMSNHKSNLADLLKGPVPLWECKYKFCQELINHNTRCCLSLHRRCSNCGLRGHSAYADKIEGLEIKKLCILNAQIPIEDLAREFLQVAKLGLMTKYLDSVPATGFFPCPNPIAEGFLKAYDNSEIYNDPKRFYEINSKLIELSILSCAPLYTKGDHLLNLYSEEKDKMLTDSNRRKYLKLTYLRREEGVLLLQCAKKGIPHDPLILDKLSNLDSQIREIENQIEEVLQTQGPSGLNYLLDPKENSDSTLQRFRRKTEFIRARFYLDEDTAIDRIGKVNTDLYSLPVVVTFPNLEREKGASNCWENPRLEEKVARRTPARAEDKREHNRKFFQIRRERREGRGQSLNPEGRRENDPNHHSYYTHRGANVPDHVPDRFPWGSDPWFEDRVLGPGPPHAWTK